MSNFGVYAHRLTILPHPHADAIEIAQVGGFQSIVSKGAYKTGDIAFYIPEQAILPDELIKEMGLENKLAGKAKNRVKAIRLRGVVSQGLIYQADIIVGPEHDYAPDLGITKWEPQVPVHMAGNIKPCTWLRPMLEINNIKANPTLFDDYDNEVVVTEKIHGTCTIFGYDFKTNEFVVGSKGLAKQHFSLEEMEHNVYWRMANKYKIKEFFKSEFQTFVDFDARIFMYAETFGPGVQDLQYGVAQESPSMRVISLCIESEGKRWWQRHENTKLATLGWDQLEVVPTLYVGRYDHARILELAEGDTTLGAGHIREGVVVASNPIEKNELGEYRVAKFINDDYLFRKNGTEYE